MDEFQQQTQKCSKLINFVTYMKTNNHISFSPSEAVGDSVGLVQLNYKYY